MEVIFSTVEPSMETDHFKELYVAGTLVQAQQKVPVKVLNITF
jgi:hypothetical protein